MFWERLYSLCIDKGIRPNTLTKDIGLSTATATKWKNGAIPSGEIIKDIADYFGCTTDYLLGRTDFDKEIDECMSTIFRTVLAESQKLNIEGKDLLSDIIGEARHVMVATNLDEKRIVEALRLLKFATEISTSFIDSCIAISRPEAEAARIASNIDSEADKFKKILIEFKKIMFDE